MRAADFPANLAAVWDAHFGWISERRGAPVSGASVLKGEWGRGSWEAHGVRS